MAKQFYVYELEDYFAPTDIPGTKQYFGALKDLLSVGVNAKEAKETEAVVLNEKTVQISEDSSFVFLNSYDCRYEIEISGLSARVMLVDYGQKYAVFVFAEIKNPRYRPEAPYGDCPDDFKNIENSFWGLPGQIEVKKTKDDNLVLFNHLGYIEKTFSKKTTIYEAAEYFMNLEVPSLQGFFEDVFGDR